jgi:hypothetical protein
MPWPVQKRVANAGANLASASQDFLAELAPVRVSAKAPPANASNRVRQFMSPPRVKIVDHLKS